MSKSTVIEHICKNKMKIRMCIRCTLIVDENGDPDPRIYNQKAIERIKSTPERSKCKHEI